MTRSFPLYVGACKDSGRGAPAGISGTDNNVGLCVLLGHVQRPGDSRAEGGTGSSRRR